jgi:uncharacterized protein YdaU (DUF1376 family)
MRTDLTRFDFRALRFLKSEDVELMAAEEVGQFVLLMCHAWLGGKNASLPNNPILLAKYARSEQVSDVVMREWKEGLDGRLYNETLSEEWEAAVGRSAHGTRAATARWSKEESPASSHQDAPAMPEHCPGNPVAVEGVLAKPIQTNPTQTNPNQPKTSSSEAIASDKNSSKPISRKVPPPEGFDNFWSLYPRKQAKKKAQEAWRKIKVHELSAILNALREAVQTEQWQKDGAIHPTSGFMAQPPPMGG